MRACVQSLTSSSVLQRIILFIMFTLAYTINLQRQSDEYGGPPTSWTEGAKGLQLEIYPPHIDQLPVHTQRNVHINCSMLSPASSQLVPVIPESQNTSAQQNTSLVLDFGEEFDYDDFPNFTYIAMITSQHPNIAIALGSKDRMQNTDNRTDEILLEISPFTEATFTVEARSIGRALIMIRIQSYYSYYGDDYNSSDPTVKAMSVVEYHVTVVRQLRTVDLVFDCVVAVVAGLNSFSMGCLTDWPSLRYHMRHPSALLIGLACQILVMPAVSIKFPFGFCLVINEQVSQKCIRFSTACGQPSHSICIS